MSGYIFFHNFDWFAENETLDRGYTVVFQNRAKFLHKLSLIATLFYLISSLFIVKDFKPLTIFGKKSTSEKRDRVLIHL